MSTDVNSGEPHLSLSALPADVGLVVSTFLDPHSFIMLFRTCRAEPHSSLFWTRDSFIAKLVERSESFCTEQVALHKVAFQQYWNKSPEGDEGYRSLPAIDRSVCEMHLFLNHHDQNNNYHSNNRDYDNDNST
jgi:hypothetical protein